MKTFQNTRNLMVSIFAVYLLTSLHHLYGAIIYDTPWRNHIALQGLSWLTASFILLLIYYKWEIKWSYWLFLIITTFFFVLAIGVYEGLYNHIVKDILYFAGMSPEKMKALFPPPKYEMPNNYLYEITGCLTFFVSMFCAYMLFTYSRSIADLKIKISFSKKWLKLLLLPIGFALLWIVKDDPFGWKFWFSAGFIAISIVYLFIDFSFRLLQYKNLFKKISGGFLGLIGAILLVLSLMAFIDPRILMNNVPLETSKEQWKQDLNYLEKAIPILHKDFYKLYPEKEFKKDIAELKTKLNQLENYQIKCELMKIVSNLNIAHTIINPLQPQINFHGFPLNAYFFDDGLFVTRAADKYNKTVGAEIIKINGVEIENVVSKISELMPVENEYVKKFYSQIYCMMPEMLKFEKIIPNEEEAIFTFRDGNKNTFDIKIEAEPMMNWAMWFLQAPHESNVLNSIVNININKDYFWFKYLEKQNSLYVQFNSVQNKDDETIKEFVNRIEQNSKEKNVDRIILDIRNNDGGNNSAAIPLLDYFENHPKFSKKGNLFVLISRKTASAAVQVAALLRNSANAVLVGEPTFQGNNHYGDANSISLPNSKISINLSTTHWMSAFPEDNLPYIDPDIRVNYNSEHYFNGKDPVLEAVASFNKQAYENLSADFKTERTFLLNPYEIVEIKEINNRPQLIIRDFTRSGIFSKINFVSRSVFYIKTDIYDGQDGIYETGVKNLRIINSGDKFSLEWNGINKQLQPIPQDYKFPVDLIGQERLSEAVELINENPSLKHPGLERIFNGLGYYYLGKQELETSLKVFKINVDLFPNAPNTYDSYAEALLNSGDKDGAKLNYKKSLELNPYNQNAKDFLGIKN